MVKSRVLSAENIASTYRRYAPLYDSVFGAVLEPGRRALAQAVVTLAPATLLEVGVGTGLMLGRYPSACAVVGVDLCPEMLAVAGQRAAQLKDRRIRLEVMNAESLDLPDASFDCVTVPYVLSVTPNPERLVAEIRRVCKPGGSIIIVNHFSGSRFWWLLERLVRPLASRVGFRSEFSFTEHIARYDWQVCSVKSVNFFGLSKVVTITNA